MKSMADASASQRSGCLSLEQRWAAQVVCWQPHTEGSAGRGSLTIMESDLALAKRLEDNLAQSAAFAKLDAEVVQSEVRANLSKCARQDEAAPQDSVITGGASSSVRKRRGHANTTGKRPLDPGDDDKVCGLDLCDDFDECSVYVNTCEGDYQMSRMRTARKPISCRCRDSNKGDSKRVEVRSRLVAREIKQKGTASYFAGAPPLALVVKVRDKQGCDANQDREQTTTLGT